MAPLPGATVAEKLERASGDESEPADGDQDGDTGAAADAPGETPGLEDAARARRGADEQWVRECRLAVERAERRVRALEAAVAEAGRPEPDETAHRAFAKRASEARGAIGQARTVHGQAELDLIHATELAKVALDGLLAARAGADWRALEHARQARARRRRRGRSGLGGPALRRPAHRQGRVRARPPGRGVAGRPPLVS